LDWPELSKSALMRFDQISRLSRAGCAAGSTTIGHPLTRGVALNVDALIEI
jgi:hypothetical protein